MTSTRRSSDIRRSAAVTWVDRHRALVAHRNAAGEVRVHSLARRLPLEDEQRFLARVSLDVGPARRVVVMGPEPDRIEFERVDVAIHRRPDRLVDAPGETTLRPTEAELIARLEPIG
jgi:hypothetical protein